MPKKQSNLKWYAINVETGTEASVKKEIKREALIHDLDKLVKKIISPTEKIEEKRNTSTGTKKVTKYEKKLPGYLMVQCELTDEVLMLVKDVRGVYGFLPLDATPQAIPGPQVEHILALDKRLNSETQKKVVLNYKVGEQVTVIHGTWKNSEGTVKAIAGSDAEPLITVTITIWGRPVDVPNLAHNHVRKV